jgi:hypothetical protein
MNADLSTGELRISAEYGSPTERIAILEQGGKFLKYVFHRDVFN